MYNMYKLHWWTRFLSQELMMVFLWQLFMLISNLLLLFS